MKIPSGFKIPKGYSHTFVFFGPSGNFKVIIHVRGKRGMKMVLRGQAGKKEASLALDWIHETVQRIRIECQ